MIVETKFRRLSPSEDLGYPLERLQIFSVQRGTGFIVTADGFYLDPEFLVLRGSRAFVEPAPAFGRPEDRDAQELREALVANGTFVRHGPLYEFQQHYVFQSSSLAASVIVGQTVNGPGEWRDFNGTKLAELYASA